MPRLAVGKNANWSPSASGLALSAISCARAGDDSGMPPRHTTARAIRHRARPGLGYRDVRLVISTPRSRRSTREHYPVDREGVTARAERGSAAQTTQDSGVIPSAAKDP